MAQRRRCNFCGTPREEEDQIRCYTCEGKKEYVALLIKAEKFKEELWSYMDTYLAETRVEEKQNARHYMNSLLDGIDSFEAEELEDERA